MRQIKVAMFGNQRKRQGDHERHTQKAEECPSHHKMKNSNQSRVSFTSSVTGEYLFRNLSALLVGITTGKRKVQAGIPTPSVAVHVIEVQLFTALNSLLRQKRKCVSFI